MVRSERAAALEDLSAHRVSLALMARELNRIQAEGVRAIGMATAAWLAGNEKSAQRHEDAALASADLRDMVLRRRCDLLAIVRTMESELSQCQP